MGTLTGRHALITGGRTGIGAAIARTRASAGASVSIVGRRRAPLEEVAAGLENAVVIIADVTREFDCEAMANAADKIHGPIDIVIANAGMVDSAPVTKIDLAYWQWTIEVNLTSTFLMVKSVLLDITREHSGASGRIVFIASTAGLKDYPYVAAYCAAKHGVAGFSHALSIELAQTGVTVNAICTGYTGNLLLANAVAKVSIKTGRSADDGRSAFACDNDNGRLISPEEVAQKVLWLCMPGADGTNGQAISKSGAVP
jgi:NAD(P)-dependent dehydrogenase (short-subunit alcohol dehydrogenase family)